MSPTAPLPPGLLPGAEAAPPAPRRARRLLVLGVGNRFRRDDGVGPFLADRLRGRLPDWVEVRSGPLDMPGLVELLASADEVLLLDAVRSGAPAGTLHRLDGPGEAFAGSDERCSTHGFGAAAALALARALGQAPPVVRIVGIEGEEFGHGEGLSRAVERAATALVPELLEALASSSRPD